VSNQVVRFNLPLVTFLAWVPLLTEPRKAVNAGLHLHRLITYEQMTSI